MVFSVIGIDAVSCQNDLPIPLIRIDCRRAYTGVGVNSSENQYVGLCFIERPIQIGPIESAVVS